MQLRGKWLCQERHSSQIHARFCAGEDRFILVHHIPTQNDLSREVDLLAFQTSQMSYHCFTFTYENPEDSYAHFDNPVCEISTSLVVPPSLLDCLNYLHKRWKAAEGKEIQATRMGKKHYPGYIMMEPWATDTQCKHQSGMEKTPHPRHNPPLPSPPSQHPQWKKVRKIGLCSKSERWKKKRGWMSEQVRRDAQIRVNICLRDNNSSPQNKNHMEIQSCAKVWLSPHFFLAHFIAF